MYIELNFPNCTKERKDVKTMEWLAQNWQYLLVAFYVAEKIVKLTPTKYDDILLEVVMGAIYKLMGKTYNNK